MRCSIAARLALLSAAGLMFASASARAEGKWGTVEGTGDMERRRCARADAGQCG